VFTVRRVLFLAVVLSLRVIAQNGSDLNSKVAVLTVCEALNDLSRYNGKTVVLVGKFASTSEGAWLSEDCGLYTGALQAVTKP
jgi:hypothetical protein